MTSKICLSINLGFSNRVIQPKCQFSDPLISYVHGPILIIFGVVRVISGWFCLVYYNAGQVVSYLYKYCTHFVLILQ